MTPVMVLTDGYIANAAEPWRVPDMASFAPFPVTFHTDVHAEGHVNPYQRDPDTLARIWIKPGTPGLTHRIGGIEKGVNTGNINYEAANHQAMTDIRRTKMANVAQAIPLADGRSGTRARAAGDRRLGVDLRPDPQGGPARAGARPRRRAYPPAPHLAAAGNLGRRCCAATTR